MPETVQLVELPKVLRKLDAIVSDEDTRVILADVGGLARTNLINRMPSDWNRPRQVSLLVTKSEAVLDMPRYTYVFFERGSQYPRTDGGKRQHQRRRNAGQILRIQPRRYLRKTKAYIRRQLVKSVMDLKTRVEKAWSA